MTGHSCFFLKQETGKRLSQRRTSVNEWLRVSEMAANFKEVYNFSGPFTSPSIYF